MFIYIREGISLARKSYEPALNYAFYIAFGHVKNGRNREFLRITTMTRTSLRSETSDKQGAKYRTLLKEDQA